MKKEHDPLGSLADFSAEFTGIFNDGSAWDTLFSGYTAESSLPDGYRAMLPSESPRVHELISNFRYKPGWSFHLMTSLTAFHADEPHLLIRASVPHRDRPRTEITIEGIAMVWPRIEQMDGDRPLWEWLRSAIGHIESHETDEWFTVNGVRVFDPHKPKEGSPE